jgi:hypothetical protein
MTAIIHSMTYVKKHKGLDVFQCHDVSCSDAKMALAAAFASTPDLVTFKDINFYAETMIVDHLRPSLNATKRQLIVIELQAFPFLQARIDDRDQRVVNPDTDPFSLDIIKLWESYDPATEIPLIITNPDIGHCGLKRHPFTK